MLVLGVAEGVVEGVKVGAEVGLVGAELDGVRLVGRG